MHPNIVTSNSEIHFYDRDENFAKGYSWYKAQMPLSYNNQITLEKTPCYIWSERALNEIYKLNKKTKLIVIFKDPVARLVSMKLTVRLIICPYFKYFQIHILEGSDFTKDPATEITKLETFLQVPHFITEKNFYFNTTKGFFCMRPLHTSKGSCLGDNKGRQYPRLDPFVEKRLYEYYREHNEQLFQLLGRRYSWNAPDYIRS
ncbi:unnamed protein product [Candidula unifasciata]|uniref:Sulfotransferase n=1 Tax=Candidula unifasciata TaxID=100452 RepID=A0A8S3ZR55_9EUPU|nr:unnamed protein product [Candidula unifasciata]